MKSLFSFLLSCFLFAGILGCFKRQPLRSDLKKYLAQKPSCADTLFPEPPCCGQSIGPTYRIIDGDTTGLREQTWTVYLDILAIRKNDSHKLLGTCGGSLINSQWVLTAGHCFYSPNYTFTMKHARLGEWDAIDDPDCVDGLCAPKVEKIKVAEIIFHPKYDLEWVNDLVLLRLERPVAYSDFIRPICLPLKPLKKKCFENQIATALGWGDVTLAGEDSRTKLKTRLNIWETDKCNKFKSDTIKTLNKKYHICASSGTNSTCHGDSGGPLTLRLPNTDDYYLMGVVEGGPSCDPTKHPILFSVVNFNWIVDVILKKRKKFDGLGIMLKLQKPSSENITNI